MHRIGIYILLIFIYLGLSRGFTLSSKGIPYFISEKMLDDHFQGAPLSILLVDYFEAGIFTKTYYHKYKVIYGFHRDPQIITVRASKKYYEHYKPLLGMSIFRRKITDYQQSTLPLPPGMLYVGDLAYGRWKYHKSGERFWKFYDAYKNYPSLFGWGNFSPSQKFFKMMRKSIKNQVPFLGDQNQFGTEGSVTKKTYPRFYNKNIMDEYTLKIFLTKILSFQSTWINEDE